MNDKVEAYLANLPSPQQQICRRLRAIILDTFEGIEESFKNGVPWYEDKFYLVGLKDHVNIGFAIEGLNNEELKRLEGSGKIMRHIKIYAEQDIDENRIVSALKMVKL